MQHVPPLIAICEETLGRWHWSGNDRKSVGSSTWKRSFLMSMPHSLALNVNQQIIHTCFGSVLTLKHFGPTFLTPTPRCLKKTLPLIPCTQYLVLLQKLVHVKAGPRLLERSPPYLLDALFFSSRIKRHPTSGNGLQTWCISWNLRKLDTPSKVLYKTSTESGPPSYYESLQIPLNEEV